MYPLTVFYDGSCSVCRREMQVYQRNNPQKRLVFIDISQPDFIAQNYGKTEQKFMARMHVRDADGVYATGVAAFILIWQAYPENSVYPYLGKIVGFPGINQLACLCYALFARYRHRLPQTQNCSNGSCRPDRAKKNIK
jgi:predicted DCC family thiol-disulfide oxidoreductase YuxK